MPLEELHGFLMLLRRGARLERAEVTALAGLGILFARIEPVLAGGKFADHGVSGIKLYKATRIVQTQKPERTYCRPKMS